MITPEETAMTGAEANESIETNGVLRDWPNLRTGHSEIVSLAVVLQPAVLCQSNTYHGSLAYWTRRIIIRIGSWCPRIARGWRCHN